MVVTGTQQRVYGTLVGECKIWLHRFAVVYGSDSSLPDDADIVHYADDAENEYVTLTSCGLGSFKGLIIRFKLQTITKGYDGTCIIKVSKCTKCEENLVIKTYGTLTLEQPISIWFNTSYTDIPNWVLLSSASSGMVLPVAYNNIKFKEVIRDKNILSDFCKTSKFSSCNLPSANGVCKFYGTYAYAQSLWPDKTQPLPTPSTPFDAFMSWQPDQYDFSFTINSSGIIDSYTCGTGIPISVSYTIDCTSITITVEPRGVNVDPYLCGYLWYIDDDNNFHLVASGHTPGSHPVNSLLPKFERTVKTFPFDYFTNCIRGYIAPSSTNPYFDIPFYIPIHASNFAFAFPSGDDATFTFSASFVPNSIDYCSNVTPVIEYDLNFYHAYEYQVVHCQGYYSKRSAVKRYWTEAESKHFFADIYGFTYWIADPPTTKNNKTLLMYDVTPINDDGYPTYMRIKDQNTRYFSIQDQTFYEHFNERIETYDIWSPYSPYTLYHLQPVFRVSPNQYKEPIIHTALSGKEIKHIFTSTEIPNIIFSEYDRRLPVVGCGPVPNPEWLFVIQCKAKNVYANTGATSPMNIYPRYDQSDMYSTNNISRSYANLRNITNSFYIQRSTDEVAYYPLRVKTIGVFQDTYLQYLQSEKHGVEQLWGETSSCGIQIGKYYYIPYKQCIITLNIERFDNPAYIHITSEDRHYWLQYGIKYLHYNSRKLIQISDSLVYVIGHYFYESGYMITYTSLDITTMNILGTVTLLDILKIEDTYGSGIAAMSGCIFEDRLICCDATLYYLNPYSTIPSYYTLNVRNPITLELDTYYSNLNRTDDAALNNAFKKTSRWYARYALVYNDELYIFFTDYAGFWYVKYSSLEDPGTGLIEVTIQNDYHVLGIDVYSLFVHNNELFIIFGNELYKFNGTDMFIRAYDYPAYNAVCSYNTHSIVSLEGNIGYQHGQDATHNFLPHIRIFNKNYT